MDAIRHHSYGPPETLVLEQIPEPTPGAGQVLIAATAHGVHLMDTSLRRGEASGPLEAPELPAVPGREVAGTVVAVGPEVDPAWVGTRVAAHLGATPDGGGYARRVRAPASALHLVPDGLDEADAIAMIGTGRMALHTLEIARLSGDDVLVVTAAAGGLGSLFVQAGLAAGARVLALAGGPEKVELVRGLGPAESLVVLDYRAQGWPAEALAVLRTLGGPATVVLDGVGGDLGTAAARLLGPGGRLVVHGWSSGHPNRLADPDDGGTSEIEVRYAVGPGAPAPADLRGYQEEALARAATGSWRVLTHRVPFAEAARAHRELEERRTTGKVVLV
ncbi:zinc-binding dehydrogenase [Georgenia halophila]|uniref:Zinc-binding dehydrogenase n=1 Tax=Georgenia halophila TaxID=620889 RepID=A0ABP8LJQ3_9MICO